MARIFFVQRNGHLMTALFILLAIGILSSTPTFAVVIDGFSQLRFQENLSLNGSTLNFYTSNISRIFITASGNIGIGTASPARKLEVVGDVAVYGTINATLINATTGNFSGTVQAARFVGDGSGLTGILGSGGSSPFNSSGENVYLNDTTARLGVGTSSPAEKLTILGNASFTGDVIFGASVIYGGGQGGNPDSAFGGWVDAGNFVRLETSTDLVGIGTATPTNALTVVGTVNATNFTLATACSNGEVLKFQDGAAICGTDSAGSGGSSPFNSSGSNAYLNDSTASLGIRTRPSGGSALEVAGKINATGLNITGTNENATFMGDVRIMGTLYGGSPIKISGGVNISGVPSGVDALFVQGSSGEKIFRISNEGQVNITPSAGNTTFDENTLFVDASNNRVGIGTATPSTALDISGTVTATAFVGDGSLLTGVGGGTTFNRENITLYLGGSGANDTLIRSTNTTFFGLFSKVADAFSLANLTGFLGVSNSSILREENASTFVRTSNEFNKANFTSNLNLINDSISLWNISGSNIFPKFITGNVGIGTTSPAEKLVVIGKVNISDALNVTGTVQASKFVGDGSGLTGISTTPAGAIMFFAGISAPSGWLTCNGTNVSRSTYSELFSAIGTLYGAGDGTNTFNLPNMTGRTPLMAGIGSDINGRSYEFGLGNRSGEYNHTLSEAEMPSHTHPSSGGTQAVDNVGSSSSQGTNAGDSGSAGSSQPHTIMQPFIALNCIIKT